VLAKEFLPVCEKKIEKTDEDNTHEARAANCE
jgi:hypothetical protein